MKKRNTIIIVVAVILSWILLYLLSPVKFSFNSHSGFLCGGKGYQGLGGVASEEGNYFKQGLRNIGCCEGTTPVSYYLNGSYTCE